MSREPVSHNKPVFEELHPRIYGVAAGLVAWFVLSAWVLFDRGGDIALSLGFVTVLLLMAVMLPWVLSEIWRKHRAPYEVHPSKTTFRDWKAGDFAVWGARLVAADGRRFRSDRDRHRVCDRECLDLTTTPSRQDQRLESCTGPPASDIRAPRPLIMTSSRSRSFSKLVSIVPSSDRPRGSFTRIGSTKRPLTRIS
jgi:hypothetical protein